MRPGPTPPLMLPPLLLCLTLLHGCSGDEHDDDNHHDASDGTLLLEPIALGDVDNPVEFTLSGTIIYEDKLYGRNEDGSIGFIDADGDGAADTTTKPVRHAEIEVVDEDGRIIARTATGADGSYTFTATAEDTVRVRVLAKSDADTGMDVQVDDRFGNLLAVSAAVEPGAGVFDNGDIAIPVETAAGAFNILDVFISGHQFAHALSGSYPPAIRGYWQPGNAQGTFFCSQTAIGLCPNGPGIHILGGEVDATTGITSGDTDEYDDDVLWHEYGHFLEYANDTLDSHGGQHTLDRSDYDLRLAWSEGWSDYISGAIKQWIEAEGLPVRSDNLAASAYVDTVGTADYYVAYNFDMDYNSLASSSDPDLQAWEKIVRYATNEGAIAKVLWNLDKRLGTQGVWDAFAGGLKDSTELASVESFWESLLEERTAAEVSADFDARYLFYAEDDDEPNDSQSNAVEVTPGTALRGTLYKGGDVDWYQFTADEGRTYTVETVGQSRFDHVPDPNPADTQLRVVGVDSAEWSHDNLSSSTWVDSATQNINNGYMLASRVTFTAQYSGDYFVEVTVSEQRPAGAPRYGGYKLTVTDTTP